MLFLSNNHGSLGPQASPYPLILSLEIHCSVEQQAVMAQHLSSILGKKLLRKPLNELPLKQLPSPEVTLPLFLFLELIINYSWNSFPF